MQKRVLVFILALLVLVGASCAPAESSGQDNNTPVTVPVITMPPATQTSEPTVEATLPVTSATAATKTDIGSALNLVIGAKDSPSVYSSYHLVATITTPSLSDDKTSVITKTTEMTADVQGDNVHLFYTRPGEDKPSEGYIIGDKEYRITNGVKEEMIGQIAVTWAFWHVEAVIPFSAAAALASKTTTETLEGREADVWAADSTTIDPAVLESFRTFGMFPLNTINGMLWIDQQTGGALQAKVDYSMDIINPDNDQKVGVGEGHLDLAITQVGKATVTLP